MALKPTIYKINLTIADLNRDYYNSHALTLALHPSETPERLMARVVAFCLNASDALTFTSGLSTPEEPDIRALALDGQTQLWIDVGEPSAERIKKAVRQATHVRLYSFNTKSDIWWQQLQGVREYDKLGVFRLDFDTMRELAQHLKRTQTINVTVSEDTAFMTLGDNSVTVNWQTLKAA